MGWLHFHLLPMNDSPILQTFIFAWWPLPLLRSRSHNTSFFQQENLRKSTQLCSNIDLLAQIRFKLLPTITGTILQAISPAFFVTNYDMGQSYGKLTRFFGVWVIITYQMRPSADLTYIIKDSIQKGAPRKHTHKHTRQIYYGDTMGFYLWLGIKLPCE